MKGGRESLAANDSSSADDSLRQRLPTPSSLDFDRRRHSLRRLLPENSLAALLVTDELNVTYLTGFTGDSSYLLVADSRELLITDGRYTQQLAEECPDLPLAIRQPGSSLPSFAADCLAKLGLASLGIEADHVTLSFHEKLHGELKSTQLAHTSGLVEQLREIKDAGEIDAIRQAIHIAESAFTDLRKEIRRGQTEKEVADDLEYRIRRRGGTCSAFPTIVGVGPRAALPHGRPTRDSRLGDAEFVLIDWGARGPSGYHSDLTRVLVTGKLSPQLQTVYGVVLSAQRAAIAAIRPGAVMKEVDAAARTAIEAAGYGRQFNHALGHGLGLAVHELPRLAPDQSRQLAPGMVVTVEPGVYIPGSLGVRIEDDILVTDTGHEVLTSLPQELEECIVASDF
jgi:Xaa-Pro aminopeptidase